MVALEGLNFKFLALVFKFDLLNLNSAGLCRTQAHFLPRKNGAKNLFFKTQNIGLDMFSLLKFF